MLSNKFFEATSSSVQVNTPKSNPDRRKQFDTITKILDKEAQIAALRLFLIELTSSSPNPSHLAKPIKEISDAQKLLNTLTVESEKIKTKQKENDEAARAEVEYDSLRTFQF